MGLFFTFDFLLKPPQPTTGLLFCLIKLILQIKSFTRWHLSMSRHGQTQKSSNEFDYRRQGLSAPTTEPAFIE